MIPEALGGRLTARFLCVACNSKIGHQFEGEAKSDPTIRLLVAKLSSSIPRLAQKLSEGQTYVSEGLGGKSRGRVKNGEFVVRSEKLDDDSLIQPTPLAAQTIKKMLLRDGHDEASITEALRLFEKAPENTRVNLSPALGAIKWQVAEIQPSLDGPLLNPLVPLKSAYEFLALHIDTAIYENSQNLAAVRRALSDGSLDSEHIMVERLYAPEAKPFHGLIFEGNDPYAKVQVRLFGQLAFRVHFYRLSVAGPRGIYTHDLVTNLEHVEKLPEST